MAYSRSRGQPFDSNRHSVVCLGGGVAVAIYKHNGAAAVPRVRLAQPASNRADAPRARKERRNIMFVSCQKRLRPAPVLREPLIFGNLVPASGKHTGGVLHSGRHLAQVVQGIPKLISSCVSFLK